MGPNVLTVPFYCQGWRVGMEDAQITLSELGDPAEGTAMFAVFDGHGGKEAG